MAHLVFTPTTRPAKAAPISRLVAATRTLWNRFHDARRLRATIHTLHRLNDHSLNDIGLERGNIESMARSRFLER